MSTSKIALGSVLKFCPQAYFRASAASLRIRDYMTQLENEAWKRDGSPDIYACDPNKFPHYLRSLYERMVTMANYLDEYAMRVCQMTYLQPRSLYGPTCNSNKQLLIDESLFRRVSDQEVYDPEAERIIEESRFLNWR